MAASNDRQYEDLRRELLSQRRRLLTQVVRVEEDLQWLASNIESEILEAGQDQTLSNLLQRLDEHDLAELSAIDRALERIHRGEYGRCAACSKPIPLARHQALPTTELCVACADMRERFARV